jgi:hypothetical protein
MAPAPLMRHQDDIPCVQPYRLTDACTEGASRMGQKTSVESWIEHLAKMPAMQASMMSLLNTDITAFTFSAIIAKHHHPDHVP